MLRAAGARCGGALTAAAAAAAVAAPPLAASAPPLAVAAPGAALLAGRTRGFAKRPPQPAVDPRSVTEEPTHVWGLNIRKGGEDPPVGADEDYPEWVFSLADEMPTLAQLERIPPEERTPAQEKRMARLSRRAHIKAKNASKSF